MVSKQESVNPSTSWRLLINLLVTASCPVQKRTVIHRTSDRNYVSFTSLKELLTSSAFIFNRILVMRESVNPRGILSITQESIRLLGLTRDCFQCPREQVNDREPKDIWVGIRGSCQMPGQWPRLLVHLYNENLGNHMTSPWCNAQKKYSLQQKKSSCNVETLTMERSVS